MGARDRATRGEDDRGVARGGISASASGRTEMGRGRRARLSPGRLEWAAK